MVGVPFPAVFARHSLSFQADFTLLLRANRRGTAPRSRRSRGRRSRGAKPRRRRTATRASPRRAAFMTQQLFRTARSRLYRSQTLQVNIRWKALDEIYKIYMLLHRSDLNISANFHRFFGVFKIRHTKKFEFFSNFVVIFTDFHEICSD